MTRSPSHKFFRSLLVATSTLTASLALTPAAVAAQSAQSVQVEAQSLDDALVEIGRRYGVSIAGSGALTEGKIGRAISGRMTVDQALKRLLAGSGLVAQKTNSGFVIQQASSGAARQNAAQTSTVAVQTGTGEVVTTEESDPILVTGSRIERTAADSPAPIDIVTKNDIEAFGLVDTTEVLRFVPALNQSLSSITQELGGRTSFAGGREGQAGLATLNLRGLGTARTLVLVNGRRHVGGVTNQATVDVSSIPAALIERVEVLTGGGSSIYGADAVSGVVNYILDDDFEGVQLDGNYGVTTNGGGDAYRLSATVGGNFGDGRGNAVVSAEYQFQENLRRDERSFTEQQSGFVPNSAALQAAFGSDPSVQNVLVPNITSNTVAGSGLGLITFLGNTIAANNTDFGGTSTIGGVPVLQVIERNTGVVRPFNAGQRSGVSFASNGGDGPPTITGFAPNSDTIPEIERFTVNALADYDITPEINAFIEAKYTRLEARSRVLFSINPFNIVVSEENPFTPQQLIDQRNTLAGLGEQTDLVASLNLSSDIVQQPREANRETFRIVSGFQGEISRAFSYEISANYGRTDTELVNNQELIPDRFFAGADAIADPVTGNPICRSDIDPDTPFPTSFFPSPALPGFNTFAPGDGSCVPFNVFAPTTQEFFDFAFARTVQTFELEQFVLNATFSGNSEDFFELPAGGIGYAAGVEYREESAAYQPDPLQIANLGFLSAFSDDVPTFGEFDVIEGFAEVNVPILRDQPFAETLDLDASVRIADYSSVGTTESYAVGLVWAPVSDLRFRGSYNRSVRAPNIGELFTPQVTNPGQTNPDPCSLEELDNGTSTRRANCAQFVPEGFVQPVTTLNVDITLGGNPNLIEETADTFTLGFVYQPSFIPGLSLVADYYNIDIQDGILSAPTDEVIAANCVDAATIDNPFCDAITRDPTTGVITAAQTTNLNLSAISSEGVDYQVNYGFDLGGFIPGDFSATVAGTWLISRQDVPFADFPEATDTLDEQIRFPEHFLNFALGWRSGKWSADYGFNYQSSQIRTFGFPAINRDAIEANPNLVSEADERTGDSFVHYLGGAYDVTDNFTLSLRVNNLFDREPFFGAPQDDRFRPVSALGRVVQFGARAKF